MLHIYKDRGCTTVTACRTITLYFTQPLEELLGVSDGPLTSCQEHYDQGERANGIYTIKV